MTLDQFLDDYVPRVLKPIGAWYVGRPHIGRAVRVAIGEGSACPLTAEAREHPTFWHDYVEGLGLTMGSALKIVAAADGEAFGATVCDEDIRARLLAGLGLSEPTR
jgi:hypothetical protein